MKIFALLLSHRGGFKKDYHRLDLRNFHMKIFVTGSEKTDHSVQMQVLLYGLKHC